MIRLFNTDDGELSESVTEDGKQANMRVQGVIGDLVKWAANRGYALRDFEALILSHAQVEVARQIILRRRSETCRHYPNGGSVIRCRCRVCEPGNKACGCFDCEPPRTL